MYRIVFSNDAKKDLKELSKKAPQAVKKLSKLLEEIQEHPRTGTGQVEPLKGYDGNVYSRRITHEQRLVYRIYDEVRSNLIVGCRVKFFDIRSRAHPYGVKDVGVCAFFNHLILIIYGIHRQNQSGYTGR